MVEIIIEKEKWYQSRRVWSSILSSVTIVMITAFPEYAAVVGSLALTVSIGLGLNSWVVPKVK